MKTTTARKKRLPSSLDTDLERQYREIVGTPDPRIIIPEYQSLVQPSLYRTVQTVTTYSAYEDPI